MTFQRIGAACRINHWSNMRPKRLCLRTRKYLDIMVICIFVKCLLFFVQLRDYSFETWPAEPSKRTDLAMIHGLAEKMPHLPVHYLYESQHNNMKVSQCGKLPNPRNIHITDKYWQTVHFNNKILYLWSAYLDTRHRVQGPVVRIVAKFYRERLVMLTQ